MALARRRPVLFAALGYLAVGVAVLGASIRPGRTLVSADLLTLVAPYSELPGQGSMHNQILSDVPFQFFPWLSFLGDALRSGHFPTWNPTLLGGVPLTPNGFVSAYYPVFWLVRWLSPFDAFNLFVLLHLVWGALGVYVMSRVVGVRPLPAWTMGLLGFAVAFWVHWSTHLVHLAGFVWLPWALAAAHLVVVDPRRKRVAALAAVVGLWWLGANPQYAYYGTLAMVGYAGALILARRAEGGVLRPVLAFAAAVAVGAALAAPVLLPTVGLSGRIVRDREALPTDHVPRGDVIRVLVPDSTGNTADGMSLGSNDELRMDSPFVGVAAALFAAVALGVAIAGGKRDPARLLLVAGVVVVMVLAFFALPNQVLYRLLPGADRFRGSSRWLAVLPAFALPLAALGLQDVLDGVRRARVVAAGACALSALVVVAWALRRAGDSAVQSYLGKRALVALVGIALVGAAVGLARRWPRLALAVVAAAVLGEVAFHTPRWYPRVVEEDAYPSVEVAEIAARQGGRLVHVGDRTTFPPFAPNLAMQYRLTDVHGLATLLPKEYDRYLRLIDDYGGFAIAYNAPPPLGDASKLASPLLDVLDVRTVVAAPEVPVPGYPRLSAGSPSVYARPSLGAAAVVPLAVPVTEEELWEHLGPGWDPSRTAAVVGLGRADVVRGGPGTVTGGPTGAGTERWRVDAPAGGFLRVGSNWDEGWSARIDGRRAPVLRADGVFRGVVVPAGVHEVRFSFSSRAEVRGRLVALLALPLILALAFVPARRRTWWDRASGAARGFAASPFPFPASDGGGGRRTRVAPFVHLASLAVGLVGLLWANRNQWFFGDEWEFLGGRGLVGGHPGLFSPHNEHWSTPPILVYRALYSLFGVRSYLPYVIVLAAVHLVAAHLLWRVMRRSGADAAVATALAAVFVFLGAGSENILWAFQIGFIGSVACGLGAILLVDHEGPFGGRDVAGWAVLVVGLMCSGIGVPMVAVAGVTVLLRQGRRQGVAGRSDTGRRPFDRLGLGRLGLGRLGLGRLGLGRLGLGRLGWGRAALTVSVPAAVYVVWLRLAGREGLGGRSYDQLSKLSSYVWTGVSNALASTVGSTLMAVLVLAGVVAWMVWRRHLAVSRAAPAFACALGVALLFVVFALGRAGLGTAQAKASRYVYLAIALVLPVVGLMLTDLAARGRAIRAAVLTLVAVVMVYNAALLGDHARVEAVRERRVKGTLLAAADMAVRGEPMVGAVPDPTYDPDVTIDILRRMQRDGKLPSLDYDPADRMAAAAFLQLHVDNHPILGAVPPRLAPLTADTVTEAPGTAPGCVVLIPQAPRPDVVLELDGPLSVTVRSSNGGTLEVTLEEAGPPPIAAAARTFRLDPDAIGYVNVVADIDRVVVGIPGAGTTEVCGL